MAQVSDTHNPSLHPQGDSHGKAALGPLLCWAVVFADIGSSIYYVPGILYSSVGGLAGFFVLLTMGVFVLLTLKYAEVSARFPAGGGVVSVAAQAINSWAGALGGMLILVSYFLTAAISCLSAIQYFSVVVPALLPFVLWITIGVLVLLGILNWVGISESAKVSLVGALVAFVSDLAILWIVFTHISPPAFFSLFFAVFEKETLTPTSVLVGFAGAFLAFSGLESISQLSPVMKTPRKRIISLALLLVVLTIGVTSPLLTMLSTLLQPREAADEVLSTQLISLLGGHWGNVFLQTEVAISASLILVFASNTAIIGAYHVFLALSRMDFFPAFILKRNSLRDTPHYSIALATGIPIAVLVLVNGQITILGDMYAFGLLGAFTLTCLGLDLIRYRERRAAQAAHSSEVEVQPTDEEDSSVRSNGLLYPPPSIQDETATDAFPQKALTARTAAVSWFLVLWQRLDFWLGILTTALVALAWVVSLASRPLAAAFGGSVALAGMAVAFIVHARHRQKGYSPVLPTGVEGRLPDSVLAVLVAGSNRNEAIMRTAISHARDKPVVFLYLGEPQASRIPREFEIVDPYLEDRQAKETFGKAEYLAQQAKVARRFVYRQQDPEVVARLWRAVHPRDLVVAAEGTEQLQEVSPDRIRYELTSGGKVAHLLKRW